MLQHRRVRRKRVYAPRQRAPRLSWLRQAEFCELADQCADLLLDVLADQDLNLPQIAAFMRVAMPPAFKRTIERMVRNEREAGKGVR